MEQVASATCSFRARRRNRVSSGGWRWHAPGCPMFADRSWWSG